MQLSRLFGIVYLLLNRKSVTSKELAAHFEVSTRTILRDVNALAEAGIPIYTSQGKGGGISILDHFVLNKAVLSEEEQNQILFALQGLSATGSMATEGVLGRLQDLFQRMDTDWIEVDFSRWGDHGGDKAKFELIKNALLGKHALAFTYASSYGQTTSRRVYPVRLVFKAKSWYLQAYCLAKEGVRTFKVNRMQCLEALPETFEGKAFVVPELYGADIAAPPDLVDVALRFSPHMAYRVYDEFEEQDLTRAEDGSFAVSMKMCLDDWFCGYLLSFGDAVEVLSPQSLRDEIVQRAEAIQKKYASKTRHDDVTFSGV